MVAAIKQTVTVGEGGVIEIRSPQLRPGDRAEVIILIGTDAPATLPSPLAALDALQSSLSLNEQTAQQWIARADQERKGFGTTRG